MTATIDTISFNGTYTVQNLATGEHRTFRVKTQKPDARFAPGERIIALMTGSDNEASYTGFGFVKADNTVAVWHKRRGERGKRSAYEFYAAMLPVACAALESTSTEAAASVFSFAGRDYTMTLSKRCLACNRKLTTPESLARGFGPECAARLGIS